MAVINAVAEFERDLLIERTQAGLSRARAEGRRLGGPASLTGEQRAEVARQLGEGTSVSALARSFKTSRQTILRIQGRKPCRPDRPGISPATAECHSNAHRPSSLENIRQTLSD